MENSNSLSVLWDAGNLLHLSERPERDISENDVEEAVRDWNALIQKGRFEDGEQYFRLLGMTWKGRIIVVIFSERNGMLRPATVYPANKRLRASYFKNLDSFNHEKEI
ncbi:MAG: BrnT family toxin [Bacteroidota bacterium]